MKNVLKPPTHTHIHTQTHTRASGHSVKALRARFDGRRLRWCLILIFREEPTGARTNNMLNDTALYPATAFLFKLKSLPCSCFPSVLPFKHTVLR